jgi:hypothetical protein
MLDKSLMTKCLLFFAGLILMGCNGQQSGRLEQREAHYLVHQRMESELQELLRRHSNMKHEHDQWVVRQNDTLQNEALRNLEQKRIEMETRHAAIVAEHHTIMEEHHDFFDKKDQPGMSQEQWRARYKEIESEHERMEKEHKMMKAEHKELEADHRHFDSRSKDPQP